MISPSKWRQAVVVTWLCLFTCSVWTVSIRNILLHLFIMSCSLLLSRPIPNSISGSRLEKLAHRLVRKYYLAKEPGSQGSMEVGSDIVVDAMVCQPNLKVAVCRKELDAGGEHCIVVERTKKKRKRGSDSQKSASIGVDDLASQSNLKAAVSGKELDAGTGNCIVVEQVKKKRKLGSVTRKNKNKRWKINKAKRQQALANGIAHLEPALI